MSMTDKQPNSNGGHSSEWQAHGMFDTPDNQDDWLQRVDRLTSSERYIAMMYGMMMWNLCCKMRTQSNTPKAPTNIPFMLQAQLSHKAVELNPATANLEDLMAAATVQEVEFKGNISPMVDGIAALFFDKMMASDFDHDSFFIYGDSDSCTLTPTFAEVLRGEGYTVTQENKLVVQLDGGGDELAEIVWEYNYVDGYIELIVDLQPEGDFNGWEGDDEPVPHDYPPNISDELLVRRWNINFAHYSAVFS